MGRQVDSFLASLYEKNVQQHRFAATSHDEWLVWQKELRSAFSADLGLAASLADAAEYPQEHLLEEKACNGYTRRRVSLKLADELIVPVYILLPDHDQAPCATVIACHGHGYGSRDIVGLQPDGSDKTDDDPGYQQDFAVALVRRGFVVVVPELLGFGDLRLAEDEQKPLNNSSCQRISSNLLMMGYTMAGMRVWQIMRVLDWLSGKPEVDQQKIGCMGISGGGLVCAFASALDDRIKAAVVSGYANTFKGSVMAMFHCVDNFIPGVLNHAEMPDIIGLIAPRPLLVESGQDDPIFPVAATREAITRITEIYHVLSAEDRFSYEIFPGEHRIWGEKAYPWLQQWLQG